MPDVPFGKSFSRDALHEAVELSFDYLGASTIIVQTIPIQNNVEDLDNLVAMNRIIWEYVREFEATAASNISRRKILVMDIYSLSVASYLQNSMKIGIIQNDTAKELQSKLFSRSIDDPFHFLNLTMALNDSIKSSTIPIRKNFNSGRIIKMQAGVTLYHKAGLSCGDKNCTIRSGITEDGLHWCMNLFGGRLNAGLACVVQCSLLNSYGEDLLTNSTTMRGCERSCNAQYMSLTPVLWENSHETIIKGTTYDTLENYKKQ